MKTTEEIIKQFREKYPHLYDLYIDRKTSGSFSEGENIESFLRSTITSIQREEQNKIQGIINAWIVKGKQPDYHDRIKNQLRTMWPILYYAIESCINSLQSPVKTEEVKEANCGECDRVWPYKEGDSLVCLCDGELTVVVRSSTDNKTE